MTTKGRALILGSATGGLRGVENDVEAMEQWLGGLGLSLDVRQGRNATREGMLDGLARLARDTPPGEAAVVYYSGHGGFSWVPPEARWAGTRLAPRAFQYVVPTDHDKARSFRGIFRAELTAAIRRLSERTSNITVILDCCHSADMFRDDEDLVPKGVVEPWSEGIEAHVAWLAEQGYDVDRLPELRNPAMVLVSACTVMQKAYEYARPADGVYRGLFTDCLLDVVSRVRPADHVTWDVLVRRVVARIERGRWSQRPQVSGPATRYLFSERRERRTGVLTLRDDGQGWSLSGGAAVGVSPGDRYAIVDPIASGSTQPVAEVEVEKVEGHRSLVSILAGDAARLEPGALAVPRPGGPVRQRGRIDGEGPLADELRARLRDVPGLGVIDAGSPAAPLFVLEVREHEVGVLDGDGRRLRWPWRFPPELDPSLRSARIDAIVEELWTLVRGAELLALAREASHREVPRALSYRVEWGVVEEGLALPRPDHGVELTVGERVYVSIANTGDRAIYVSLLDLGASRAITLLNLGEPEGIDLGSGDTEIFGAPELGQLLGIELLWPDEVPPDGPRLESLVLFVSNEPLPVGSWETSAWDERAGGRDMEGMRRARRAPVYAVHHLSFMLHPRAASSG